MKTIKLTIALFLIAVSFSFAQTRVMTDDEKIQLFGSSEFKEKCQSSVRDFAAYWSNHDGAGFSTESDRLTWAKNRLFSVGIILGDPMVQDQNIVAQFLIAAKGKIFTLGASPQSNATLVSAWVSENAFEEFVNQYVKYKTDALNFSIGN